VNEPTFSERVRQAGADPSLVREAARLEQLTAHGVSNVIANGKFPHWPVDRWISVVGFVGTFLTVVFVFGGRWYRVETAVADLSAKVERIDARVSSLSEKLDDVRVDVAGLKPRPTEPDLQTTAAADRRTYGYRFPPEESLIWRPK
jgi:hypothetical protein